MSDSPKPAAPAEKDRMTLFLEKWGTAAVVTLLGVLAVELAILAPMVRYGVDLTPLIGWINGTFGSTLSIGDGQPSWTMSVVLAYGITRPLKPVSLAVVFVLTPVVHRFLPRSGEDA